MPTSAASPLIGPSPPTPAPEQASGSRWGWALGVLGLLVLALGLRLWGVGHGLPYAYNVDENSHFVPTAIGLFGHGWNPHYFVNPPLFTYVLHVVFAGWFGGRQGVSDAFAKDPTEVWIVARVSAALLGTAAVGLLYLAGARLLDRRLGMLAAGVLAVAFLPVFYAHLALNDAPTTAPVCLALWGIAGVLRTGRTRDYAIAGLGLGLAAATKYTGGVVLPALLLAAAVRWRGEGVGREVLRGLALAGGVSIAAFLVGNPFSLLSHTEFQDGLQHQSDQSSNAAGKLGAPDESGFVYYLWTFTWGLGWVPALAALGGLAVSTVRDRGAAIVLGVPPVLFLLFLGLQERFFGRWMLPIYPFLCLFAALGALAAVDALRARRPVAGRGFAIGLYTVAALALCGQGLAYSVHSGRLLSRQDTRALTRAWMVAHIPPGTKVVIEPVVPDGWAQDVGHPSRATANGNRWSKYPVFRTTLPLGGASPAGVPRTVTVEDYERTLRPALLRAYEAGGYCYVIVGSTQRGRAEADRHGVPGAIAYYRALEASADVIYRATPYGPGESSVPFNFDFSFDQYPMAYDRPGPEMTVYRLKTGRCAHTATAG